MLTIEERIEEIEDEIRKTPYHKATEHHIGKLKARIARLKDEQIEKGFKSGGGGGKGFAVRKTGDASVVLVGPPSVGKSTLLNKITNADSKVAAYDFTTLGVIPGMLNYKGAKIQIFDVPGILSGAASGKGRGKEVLSIARNTDLIVITVDVKNIQSIPAIIKELHEAGVRLNERPPRVNIIKRTSGGLKVNSTTALKLNYDTIKALAAEFRLSNAEIVIKENVSLERLIDAFLGNRVYLPYLVVVNKIDLGIPKDLDKYVPEGANIVYLSAETGRNLDIFREKIWEKLEFIRVYLKKEEIDYDKPFILKKGQNLNSLLELISICTKDSFKGAKVYGPGAKFPGQEVSLTFQPQDETVVQFLG